MSSTTHPECALQLDAWMELIGEMKIKAFPEVVPAANVCDGVKMLMLVCGERAESRARRM